MQQFVDTLIHR